MRRATTGALLPELIDPNNTASDVWAVSEALITRSGRVDG
jgi:hypothetical protein